ncbi:MAG: MFS transporter [Ignavibacteria bacterium RIFOXYB2_FULL_35_12]|nr:MAG: MFS transporter [Ignavibacteria bacterium GWA2_36_19]OGU59284.1 MAG: MFS transporter [Ignavibacteria bacterium GWF2_35_20]OGU86523.1 MAG: MFS transporter [Ignavibacteria bacterium RIFOXYA12_FULL_35_25]OGU86883.1 MAG: MFS transporter [Ignavibacteria bacterium RIFOXYC12_FULL_35_11]OGU97772.1 MAG: MFS transporter [Ignavibacteria bacterium RIFOXYB12_FULL_35_14]OGU98992.1 MAG: MFS transporter [Ignavibacteria bacterium RIFOXYC2_FULL_35_16]OGV03058.1 MAG: MFS transporter [Ignavibacteria bact
MQKPRLSFWQIWNMSFGFLGIQFGFALQNANVSRIFETLGAKIEDIPILWIAAPVTGLIVQPIIGHMSDKTWNRLGRRRPFFLVGALLASTAIIFMPNSPVLWIAAGMLWIMDASINISMEPFRAFVGDMLPSEQRTIGFSMQSFFIGIGAIVASALPYMMTNWFGISNIADAGEIPDSVKFSFYIGGAVFLLSVLYTVFSTKEYSPEELKKFSESDKNSVHSISSVRSSENVSASMFNRNGVIGILVGVAGSLILHFILHENDYGLYVLFVGSIIFGLLQLIAGLFTNQNKTSSGLVSILNDLYKMPKTMRQLAVVQFFSWFALFAMWIYTTPAVTHHIYGATDPSSELYNEGANWVGVLMAVYNGFAAVMAFALVAMAKKTNRKTVHMISLIVGGLAFASFYAIKNPNLLLVSELGIGLAWASILAMPYAILAGSLPPEKMGVYMGIFNFFIVIPQITAAAILGFFVKNIVGGEAIYALLLGGASMIIAGLMVYFVEDVDEEK